MVTDPGRFARHKAAEEIVEGFRQALGPFVVAAETTRMPMMFTNAKDAAHAVIFVNEAFVTLTGYEEHEVLGLFFDGSRHRSGNVGRAFDDPRVYRGPRGELVPPDYTNRFSLCPAMRDF